MRIPGGDVPQADRLEEVVHTVDAVANGARKDTDIAKAFQKDVRQGRYYRRAGEILGFIENHRNNATLTASGINFVNNPQLQPQLLAEAVLKSRLIQRTLPFFEVHRKDGVRKEQLTKFLNEVTETKGKSMIPRRLSSVIGWLTSIGMLRESGDRYFLKGPLPVGTGIIEYEAADEPLFPAKYDLEEYNGVESSIRSAKGMLSILIDEARKERAEKAHQDLTDLVAGKIRAAKAIPKRNKYVDLSAALKEDFYLFEMKSTTDENVHSQVRKAISQLYEYRYLQQIPSAKLVVVIENPPPDEKKWLVDYLVKDRELMIAWNGDGKTLHCPAEIQRALGFLI